MSTCKAELAWNEAKKKDQYSHVIVEMGLLPDQARLRLLQSEFPRQPLMRQPEFAALREHGAWLLDLSCLEFEAFLALGDLAGSPALMGWIRTDCSSDVLAEHLSDALLAEGEAGSVYLLRSYAPNVLPLLHARAQSPWHAWLFGPLHDWWLNAPGEGWQGLPGLGLARPADYQPITLDAELWQALALDPLTYSLTSELERTAPEVFASPCHGERLAQVQQALEAGRSEGLQQAEDLSLFASLQLFDNQFPAHWPNWPQVRHQVKERQLPLAQAIRTVPA